MRGRHINVTTLQRNDHIFSKVYNVSHIWQGILLGTKFMDRCFLKIFGQKKLVRRVRHLTIFKKSMHLAAAWWHRRHHAAARDLLFLKMFRCMVRFAWFFDTENRPKKCVKSMIHLTILKKSKHLAAAWWHRRHHAAARDLLFLKMFRCMVRFAWFFCRYRVWVDFGAGWCVY